MQSKQELENWYSGNDPWQYETTPDDQKRKDIIIKAIKENCGSLSSILDIGAGEGWLTKDLPAERIAGIELSDKARDRMPEWIERAELPKKFEAVLSTGTLYSQYDHKNIAEQIKESATKYIIISGIKDWLIDYDFGKVIYQTEFPYREYTQKLTIYEISS